MKFTVLDVTVSQENESDHETAVELSHHSIAETTLRLQTEAGLVLHLRDSEIHTTYSYLNTEPEFEEDEEEEEAAPEYAIPSGEREAKHSRYLSGTAVSEPELPALTAEDWKFHEEMEDSGGWHDDRNDMPDSVRRNLLALDNYHALVNQGVHGKRLVPEFVQRLMDALPATLVAGQVVEVHLEPAEEASLNSFAALNRTQREANRRVDFENQISRNVAHAKADIAETVEAARHRFRPK